MFNDNQFIGNDVGVQLDNVPTDVKLNFQGSVFQGNRMSIDNRCGYDVDTSKAVFE